MNVKKLCFTIAGFLCFGLACIGVALPLLPTVPFLLGAAFCFAKSSEKLNEWFRGTKLYNQYLKEYVNKEGMTVGAKVTIMVTVTVLLAIGFAFTGNLPIVRWLLAIVWVCHMVYFVFKIKTVKGS